MFLTRRRNRRSNINLSHTSPTTLAPGNLVPISFIPVVGGDRLRFSPSAFVQAFPMNAPLVNGFKVCFEYFFIPTRLYNSSLLLDFAGTTDEPDNVKYPAVKAAGVPDNVIDFSNPANLTALASVTTSPGSLADYMGFPVGFTLPKGSAPRFNVVKMLGYLDVVYNYYVNQQIDSIPTASWDGSHIVPTAAAPTQNISYSIDTIERLLRMVKTSADPVVALDTFTSSNRLGSWEWLNARDSIFQRCLPPYYLESWLRTSGYNDAEIKVDLDAEGNAVSMRNISVMSHIQRWLDLCLNGGRFSDYLNSQLDTARVKNTSVPIFLGADRQYLGSNVIYQTTGAGDASSPLGAFAGQSSGGEKFRRRSFRFDEPGYFMVIASLVPDVIYSRGLDPFLEELTLSDSYVPALDNISMEPLLLQTLDSVPVGKATSPTQFTISGTNYGSNNAIGFVPAWSKMMQVVSRSHGRLTTELAYWLLERDYGFEDISADNTALRQKVEAYVKSNDLSYEDAETVIAFLTRVREIHDYTPYIRSNAYNNVFADVSNEAQNFVLTFSCSASVNREKGKVNVSTTL